MMELLQKIDNIWPVMHTSQQNYEYISGYLKEENVFDYNHIT